MGASDVSSRGYLVHWDVPGATQFITFRLHDAFTAEDWETWRRAYSNASQRSELYRVAEARLDEGLGSAVLKSPVVGRRVMQVVMDGHGGAYVVRAAVVMPNHVHLVLTMAVGSTLAKVMQQIKGASAHSVNQLLGRRGRLWQPEYFDRVVRDAEHLHRCIHYVHWNPVKARLCVDPRHYAMSTANPSYANAIEGGGLKSADPDAD